jgi:hypothetical protein
MSAAWAAKRSFADAMHSAVLIVGDSFFDARHDQRHGRREDDERREARTRPRERLMGRANVER